MRNIKFLLTIIISLIFDGNFKKIQKNFEKISLTIVHKIPTKNGYAIVYKIKC